VAGTESVEHPGWLLDRWLAEDGLPLNHLNDLALDRDGRLWIATYDGLVAFDGERFVRVPVDDEEGTPSPRVQGVAVHPTDGALWVAFETGQLQRRAPGDRSVYQFQTGAPQVVPTADGALWAPLDGGCYRFDTRPERVAELPDWPGRPIYSELRHWRLQVDLTQPERWLESDCTLGPMVGDGPRVPQGWGDFSSHDETISLGGTPIVRLSHPVTAMLAADDQLWVATRGGGLVRLRPRAVEMVPAPEDHPATVERLIEDPATGDLWARSHAGLWWSVSSPEQKVEPPDLHAVRPWGGPLPYTSLAVAAPRGSGASRWWFTQGSLREEGDDGLGPPVKLDIDYFRALDAAWVDEDTLFFGSTDVLWVYRRGEWRASTSASGAPPAGVRAFLRLPDGRVLAAAGHGLMSMAIDGSDARMLVPELRVRHLRLDNDLVWVSTEGNGLCALPLAEVHQVRAADALRCLRQANGLGVAGVHSSSPDSHGQVWVSANSGLGVADRDVLDAYARGEQDTVGVRWLGVEAGMTVAETNGYIGGSVHADDDGTLWFPTQDGVAHLFPERVKRARPPTVQVDGVRVDGEAVEVGGGPLQLDADSRLVEVRWAPIFLDPQTGLRVRHRLVGDRDWSAPTDERSVQLRGLAPGPHLFEMQAGIGESWGPIATLALDREPAWSERPEVRIGLLLAGSFFAVALLQVQRRRGVLRQRELQSEVDLATTELRIARDRLADQNEELAHKADILDQGNALLDQRNDELAARALELQELYRDKAAQAERLEELDRIKRQLIANVSHELRTPLALILGPIDVLVSRTHDPRLKTELNLVLRNAQRLQKLVDELLLLARVQAGALPLRARRSPLDDLFKGILDRFPPERVSLRLPADDPVEPLWCDRDLLDTAVGNLVANALEHGGDAPVEVSAAWEGRGDAPWVKLKVRDHGPGVPEDQREAIFGRFSQGGATNAGGLGLGLALAQELAELHGGELGLDSPPDGGACFWLALPLGVAHLELSDLEVDVPSETALEPGMPVGSGAGRVLLVEDNADLQAFLATHLRTFYTVTAVGSAEAALQALAERTVDIVITDIMLPGMSGLELAQALRARSGGAQPKVMLISARAGVEDRVEGLQHADDYLPKPFSVRELLARAAALLRRTPGTDAPTPAPAVPRESTDDARPEWATELLAKMREHVDQHIDLPTLDTDSLAHAVGMSRRTLADRMRALGLPAPAAWIRERRLSQAEVLLKRGTFETVGEVAAAVGMSRSYFSRLFRARSGVAPGAMLKRSG